MAPRTKEGEFKRTTYYMGIDPGKSGAVAVINASSEIILLEDCPPTEKGMADLIKGLFSPYVDEYEPLQAAIEHVHAMPKQGVSSTFKFGMGYGLWKGILVALEIPFVEVRPQAWQKGLFKKADGKDAAMAVASRMFPSAELYGPRGGKKDGRADALLLADWKRRN